MAIPSPIFRLSSLLESGIGDTVFVSVLLTPVVASTDVRPTETFVLEDEVDVDIELLVEALLEAGGLAELPTVVAASSEPA